MKFILLLLALMSIASTEKEEVLLSPDCAGVVKKTGLRTPFTKTCRKALGIEVDFTFVQGANTYDVPYEKWQEISKKDNIVQGPFIEWSRTASFKRIEGAFRKGSPSGAWIVRDYGGKDQIQITYDASNDLSEIAITEGKGKPVIIKIAKLKAKPKMSKGAIGMSMPLTVDPIFPNEFNRFESDGGVPGDVPINHVLFYSSPTKKEVVGAAISNYRFYPRHVCTSAQCDKINETGHVWLVSEKKENMCMTSMPAQNFWEENSGSSNVYELWFECNRFTDIFDYYSKKSLAINSGTSVYSSPGGDRTRVKGLDGGEELGTLFVEMVEKKMVGKDLWIEIQITASDKNLGNYWIPFYQGDQMTLFETQGD